MDVVRFNVIRPLALAKAEAALPLTDKVSLTLPHRDVPETLGLDALPAAVGSAADQPLLKADPASDASPLQRSYVLLNQLSDWLSIRQDRVDGDDVAEEAKSLSSDLGLDDAGAWAVGTLAQADPTTLYRFALLGIRAALATIMARGGTFAGGEQLTRLSLVADLLTLPDATLRALTVESVAARIDRRPVVLKGLPAAKLAPHAQVNLIRTAKTTDLHVVRSEWRAFIPSDVANIRNLMAGESFGQRDKTVSETETTATTETQQSTSTQQQSQTKLDSELSQQINTQLGVTVNGHFDSSASFNYPQITASVSAGIDASLSIQKSESQASKIAREAVTTAVSQVDSMNRESRTRRELMRTEQGFKYSLENKTDKNVHAIYRWVDRIDSYQVFRFPDRFLLEFQIPEPAEYYRWRTKRSTDAANAVDAPPDWTLTAKDITPGKLVELAARYRASDLPGYPEKEISVATSLTLDLDKASLPADNRTTVWNTPALSKDLDVPIPPNYLAVKVNYSGEGYPIRGTWENSEAIGQKTGYHSAFATVSIAGQSSLYWNGGSWKNAAGQIVWLKTHTPGTDIGGVQTVEWDDTTEPFYGSALLAVGSDDSAAKPRPEALVLNAPGVANTLKISVTTAGVANSVFSFQVICTLSEEAKGKWVLSVYDALYAAWAQWKKDYQTAQTRQQLVGTAAADAGGTQRNQQIIHEELKREVIAWLLDEQGFKGRPEMEARATNNGNETSFADFNFSKARADAPLIQFMEQAFEWNNMTYVFYPYYWADRTASWDTLSQITANDPEFERFLRAGSSRVIVPATPGFESAVQNWLVYKVPFLNGRLPAPDEQLYVDIDQEIRNITSPWQGGIAGDYWQSRISTTLLYLEEEGELPFDNDAGQLPATQGQLFIPKIY